MRCSSLLIDLLANGLLILLIAAPAAAAENHGRIAPYAWPKGQSFSSDISVTFRSGREKHTTNHTTLYRVDSASEAPPENRVVEDSEGSGTGFVVSEQGYLLTCHHVVEDATEIEVTLDEQQHRGEVVGSNEQRDLAIVKIEAQGLTALPLAYDDEIEIGMELRAIGFPALSDARREHQGNPGLLGRHRTTRRPEVLPD